MPFAHVAVALRPCVALCMNTGMPLASSTLVLIQHLPLACRVVCKATASTLQSQLVWLQRYVQNSLCKATLHDFTIAFQHFTAQTSLQPQGIRGRHNAQVRGWLFGHALPMCPPQSWPNSPLVAAQHSVQHCCWQPSRSSVSSPSAMPSLY